MDDKALEELVGQRRAEILASPTRTLSRVADEIEQISLRLHELNAESEAHVWAAHPERYEAARPVLRLLGKDVVKMLEDAVAVLRALPEPDDTEP